MKNPTPVLDQATGNGIVNGSHTDPFAELGLHPLAEGDQQVVRAFLPGAEKIEAVVPGTGVSLCKLQRIHNGGLFEGMIKGSEAVEYQLQVSYPLTEVLVEDPYRFPSSINPDDLYLFHEGSHEQAYKFLGANPMEFKGVTGVRFVVWAPNARKVALVGDFNNWDDRVHVMRLHYESGIWEIFLPQAQPGDHYKYAIQSADGSQLPLKSDPYARLMELRPGSASRVPETVVYNWGDQDWMTSRGQHQHTASPIAIYEVHLGSWRRDGESSEFLNYRQLAVELVSYANEMRFTHIQLLPISEYPFDGSWGYQPLGMFAPTSRFGTPDDFRYFIDYAHQHGLGVLLDWVPGHFPTDEHGLGIFDGTHLYEHSDPRQGFHPDWKTFIFNYERPEVRSYLLSNALYWLQEFHVDGLRFDAVASMLYLDYSREEGQWLPNRHGGRENLAAIDLIRLINTRAYKYCRDIMMVAEESTAWPGVTQFADSGGLGFEFKWNLGWMNDSLSYMSRDPIHRRYHHNDMTFGLLYAFTENFILPLSHDEVVHGKRSLLEKMPGDEWQKFANLRAYLGFMWVHPGKKLLFMGGEFAQRSEWNHDYSLDWHLLQYPDHQGMQQLVRDLNTFYVQTPALWCKDTQAEGFEWITAGEHSGDLFVFVRRGEEKEDWLLIVCNLTPTLYQQYRIGVPESGSYREYINTDKMDYGGTDHGNRDELHSDEIHCHGRPQSLSLTIPPLATLILQKTMSSCSED